MMVYGAIFVLGVTLLLISSYSFIRFAERISLSLKISPLVIGATFVAIGTSMPELAVSVIATIRNDAGLAFGNIIGSNIVNIFLVLPIGIAVGRLRIGTTKTQKSMAIMALVTVLFILLYAFGINHFISGWILIILAFIITVSETIWGVEGRTREDSKRYSNSGKISFSYLDLVRVPASLAGIIAGGGFCVISVEQISRLTGFSMTALGLSVTAIATSLPELIATVLSQKDREDKIAIGNIIGSNIYNLVLIGGVMLLLSPWGIIQIQEITMMALSAAVLGLIVVFFKGRNVPAAVSFLLFSLFVVHILLLRSI